MNDTVVVDVTDNVDFHFEPIDVAEFWDVDEKEDALSNVLFCINYLRKYLDDIMVETYEEDKFRFQELKEIFTETDGDWKEMPRLLSSIRTTIRDFDKMLDNTAQMR